jgi:hypothetical protein
MGKPVEAHALSAAEQVTWNLKAMSARDAVVFDKAVVSGDVEAAAAALAKVITECPPEWGAPNDPETYLNLPFFGEFGELVAGVRAEAGKLRARSSAPST